MPGIKYSIKPLFKLTKHRSFACGFVIVSSALLLLMNASAAEKTMYNFAKTNSAATWEIVNDGVMGGVSSSAFRQTNGHAVFAGELSLKNNGGFASVRSLPGQTDIAGCDTFLIRVRGDGRDYNFTARTDTGFSGPLYRLTFRTKEGQWEEHRLPMHAFLPSFRGRALQDQKALEAEKVTSVGFLLSDKQEGPFRLEVAWIKASKHSAAK